MRLSVACGAWLLVFACRPVYVPPPSPEDAGGPEDCPAMCEAIERLGCAEAWGIDPEDGPCLEWCVEQETNQRTPSLCPRWVARAESCAEVNKLSQCGD